jgi:hypothetical protein
MVGIYVYVGVFGEYVIPPEVLAMVKRFTKRGNPDRRYKGNDNFWAWVRFQEDAAKAKH